MLMKPLGKWTNLADLAGSRRRILQNKINNTQKGSKRRSGRGIHTSQASFRWRSMSSADQACDSSMYLIRVKGWEGHIEIYPSWIFLKWLLSVFNNNVAVQQHMPISFSSQVCQPNVYLWVLRKDGAVDFVYSTLTLLGGWQPSNRCDDSNDVSFPEHEFIVVILRCMPGIYND